MSFDKLKGLVSENAEALEIIKNLEQVQKDLGSSFNSIEIKFQDAIKTRDKAKDKLSLVKSKFNLDELNDETLSKFLNMKSDDKFKAEIENLKKTLVETTKSKDDMELSYKGKLQNVALDNAFANSRLIEIASNKDTLELLKNITKQGALFDEHNQIVFKNDDGSTKMLNGKPMGLDDKIESVYSNKSYAGLFKPAGNGGGGGNPNSFTQTSNVEGLSPIEKMKQARR